MGQRGERCGIFDLLDVSYALPHHNGQLTNAYEDMGHIIGVDRDEVRTHNLEHVVVNAKDEGCVDGCVDDTQNIFLAL